MSFGEDLKTEVKDIFKKKWETRDGKVVPDNTDIQLNNDGVMLDAVVLYADLEDSTEMVDSKKKTFSAEVYKAFLKCASKIISNEGGTVTAFDGDRVMGVFVGNTKNSDAVTAALKINWAVKNIVNPGIRDVYDTDYVVKHSVGIDSSDLLVARTGYRDTNDLVWVGSAANYAAKMSAIRDDNHSTWISESVFNRLRNDVKYQNGQLMWVKRNWTKYNKTIYSSSYWWGL